jgi:hypothetical protein
MIRWTGDRVLPVADRESYIPLLTDTSYDRRARRRTMDRLSICAAAALAGRESYDARALNPSRMACII